MGVAGLGVVLLLGIWRSVRYGVALGLGAAAAEGVVASSWALGFRGLLRCGRVEVEGVFTLVAGPSSSESGSAWLAMAAWQAGFWCFVESGIGSLEIFHGRVV